MKKTITIALVILYGVALLRPALPLIDYYLKLETYKAHCINKMRPALHCNGQCVLMQKLKALNVVDDPVTPPPPAKVDFQDYPVAVIQCSQNISSFVSHQSKLAIRFVVIGEDQQYIQEIFRPPLA